MKKIYVLFSFFISTGLLYGQLLPVHSQLGATAITLHKSFEYNSEKSNYDTIGWNTGFPKFCSPVCELYAYALTTSSNVRVGYWFGTNYFPAENYSYNYWAQCYLNNSNVKIIGAIAIIAAKVNLSNNDESVLEVSLYKLAGEQSIVGISGSNYVYGDGPAFLGGTPLAVATKSINDIDTIWNPNMGMNYFPFENPVSLSQDFALVSNFRAMVEHGDTAYMPCDKPGNGLGMHYAQFSIDPEQYYWLSTSFATNGQLDINIPLFAVVDKGSAGINDNKYFQGMKMSVYPNPVTDFLNIDFALQYDSEASLQIINMNGVILQTIHLGYKSNGTYSHSFDLTNIAQGNYFISLNANGTRLIKQFAVH